ncbi:MAG: DNA-binding response regulator [Candidatus Omnitrophica bacterium]|nr:DNA-binding response regulator [Candidatus Omnitrophota bacterium]MDD5488713.1 DNA-binding response regulator [Candidatus Omnitrophota bacterium]
MNGKMYNIMLVDDDSSFTEELAETLEEYNVLEVNSAEKALELLKRSNLVDVVVLDVVLPGVRGTKALAKIRKVTPEIGIIILTGHSTKDIAIEALKGGADDYIEKPVDVLRLKESIWTLLARQRNRDVAQKGVGGKLEKIKNLIMMNPHRKISLEDAAKHINLCPKYLSRLFKEKTGHGFSDFKIAVRTERGKKLLHETALSIEAISERLGYQNAESFIRIFRKKTGRTPAEFRGARSSGKKKKNTRRSGKSGYTKK